MGVIYKITSPTNRIYVGKTNNLRKRKTEHIRQAQKGTQGLLYNSIRKYGWAQHKLEIIEEVEDSLLNEREIFWIKEFKTYWKDNEQGMNLTKGGDGNNGSWMHKTELRKWFSERFTGPGGPFYGKTHTEAWRIEKSKEVSEYNKRNGIRVPEWGVEKGRLKVMRAIICYDKNGNFLKEYDSLRSACNDLKIHHSSISESCNGKITGVFGKYVFRYKTENYPIKIDVGEVKCRGEKRPVLLLTPDLEIAIEFPSSLEASQFLSIPKTTINRAAQYNFCHPIRTGHIFLYRDDYDELFEEAA